MTRTRRAEQRTARGSDSSRIQAGLLELSQDIQLAVDAAGRLQHASSVLAGWLDATPEALLGRALAEVIPAVCLAAMSAGLERARTAEQPVEWRCTWGEGAARRELAWRARLQADTGLVLAVGRDVTAVRRSEEDLRASQRLLRAVFDTLPHSIFVKDTASNYLLGNATWAARYGYSPEELIGRSTLDVTTRPEAERREALQLDQKLFAGDSDQMVVEFTRTALDGSRHVFRNWRSRLRDDDGVVIGLVGISEDISERLVAEQALRESERRFRDLIEGSIQGIVILRDRKPVFANAAYARMFGFDRPEEITSLESVDSLLPPQEARRQSGYAKARLGGEPAPTQYESEGVRKDGTHVWFDCLVKMVDWEGAPAIQATVLDITERKRAEGQLRANERLLQTVFDTVPHLLFVKDRDSNYLMANRAWLDDRGEGPAAMVGRNTLDLAHRPLGDRESAVEMDRQVLRAGRQMEFEYERTRADGGRRIYHNYRAPFHDDEGNIVGVVGISQDVTALRRAEEDVRASQRLLRLVMDTVPHNLFVKSLDGRYLMTNRAMAEFHAMEADDIIGRSAGELAGPTPEEVRVLQETDRQVQEAGTVLEWPAVTITDARGKHRVHRLVKMPLFDGEGRITSIACASEDITERLRAEQDLRASQRLLRLVMDALPHNIYVKGLDGHYVLVNRAMAAFHHLPPEQMVGSHVDDLVGPTLEERRRLLETDAQVMEQGRMMTWPEVPVTAADGRVTIRRLHKLPLRDDDGRIQGTIGISEDITQIKHIEEELRASHRLLRTVLDTIPHRVTVKDDQGRFVLVNKAWERHYLVPAEEALGRTMYELGVRPAEEVEEGHRIDERILKEGAPYLTLPLKLKALDGTAEYYLTFRAPVLNEDGRTTGIVGATVDVTELKRAEEELRASRQLLQTIFDALPVWVFVKDRDACFVLVNRRMAEDHGIQAEQVQRERPRHLSSGLTDAERARLDEMDAQLLAGSGPIDRPAVEITLPSGETRRYRTIRVPLHDDQGAVAGIVGVSEDVTERERTERAMQQAQKLESLGVLAGGIAHDFNNLLVAVLGYASLAANELPPDSPVQPLVRQIETAGQRAGDLCAQMLAYAGKGSFQVRRVQLNGLVQEMTELIRVSLARNLRLNLEFAPELPDVEVDETQLRQVVMNLLINASEAIGEGSGTITLSTGVRELDAMTAPEFVADPPVPPGSYVELEVTDTGEGMDASTLNRIFDPFFTTKFSGRGLGLAAVLGIVRGHRGALRVTSVPGSGTTFTILLPEARASARSASLPAEPETLIGSGTILVADDEPAIRELAEMLLEPRGFRVAKAETGEAALEQVRRLGAELRLVLMDVSMPGLASDDALRRMVASGLRAPVVIMSGHAESDVREQFAGLPVAAFLNKPFNAAQMLGKLGAALRDAAPAAK